MPIYVDASGEPIQAKVMSPETAAEPSKMFDVASNLATLTGVGKQIGSQVVGLGQGVNALSEGMNQLNPATQGMPGISDLIQPGAMEQAQGAMAPVGPEETAGSRLAMVLSQMLPVAKGAGMIQEGRQAANLPKIAATMNAKARLSELTTAIGEARAKGAVPGRGIVPASLADEFDALVASLTKHGGASVREPLPPIASAGGQSKTAELLKGALPLILKGAGLGAGATAAAKLLGHKALSYLD